MAKSTKFFALVGYTAISLGGCVRYVETDNLPNLKPVPVEASSQSTTPSQNAQPGAVLSTPNQPLIGPDGRPVSGNIARPGKPEQSTNVSVEVVEPLRSSDGRPACGNVIGGKGGQRKIKCDENGNKIGTEPLGD